MNEIEGLNLLDFLATGINKSDPVIQAIFSNYEGKGAIANEVEDVIAFINYYTRTDDVRNHISDSLEMITKQFVKTLRQLGEADSRLLRRMLSLTERKGDIIWGNALNMKHIFETYFEGIRAFISENTNDLNSNLLEDGDFEEQDAAAWELTGSAALTYEARFSSLHGLYFDGGAAAAKQAVNRLAPGLYTLHFFLMGKCGVQIRDSAGRYWDGTAEANNYILEWKNAPFINVFESAEWNDVYCFIRVTGEPLDELTIEFVPLPNETANIDYVRLFVKPANPSYTITVQFVGFSLTSKVLHLGAGVSDPAAGVNYKRESYYDHSYLLGRQGAYREEVYKTLLDTVRPRGIQAFAEFVEKSEV